MSTEETNPIDEPNNKQIPDPSPGFREDESSDPSSEWAKENITEDEPEVIDSKKVNEPMTESEERTWAMLAHFSVLLNLVTGFLGGVAAIIIYFVYKDRSRFVAYHAMQSFIFQSISWLGAGIISAILITVGSALSFLIIPLLCLVPGFLALLLIPASLIYGVIGGVQVNNNKDFRYWQVGDWVRDILEPPVKA